jgi:hypothetical protein
VNPGTPVDPDSTHSPLRRLLPVVLAHRRWMALALSCVLVMQLVASVTPRVLMSTSPGSAPRPVWHTGWLSGERVRSCSETCAA